MTISHGLVPIPSSVRRCSIMSAEDKTPLNGKETPDYNAIFGEKKAEGKFYQQTVLGEVCTQILCWSTDKF